MAYENNDKKVDSVYSNRVKAGKRRTYFFDVRETRGNDYFLTITESRKRFESDGYDRHKIFLYKEDFNKFIKGLTEAINHVKTELMPDFDFDAFNHESDDHSPEHMEPSVTMAAPEPVTKEDSSPAEPSGGSQFPPADNNLHTEEVDKW